MVDEKVGRCNMKIILPWKNKKITLEKDLRIIEKRLSSTLKPVDPHPKFVRNLRYKIVGKHQQKILGLPAEKVRKGLLVAGGVISFTVVIISGIRAIITILGALGLLQLNKQIKESPKVPPQSAA